MIEQHSNHSGAAAIHSSRIARSGAWFRAHPGPVTAFALLATLLLSLAWLVFPYMIQGKSMLFQVGGDVRMDRQLKAVNISTFLTRYAWDTTGSSEAEVSILLATPTYFEKASNRAAADVVNYQPNRYLVFVVNEDTHTVQLPETLPAATLMVNGVEYELTNADGPKTGIEHHRTTVLQFPLNDAAGRPLLESGQGVMELRLSNFWDPDNTIRTARWNLPIEYPPEVLEPTRFTFTMVMALGAGLLSAVLTPCLLQLVVIYIATLTGLSSEQMMKPGAISADVRRRMMYIALAFVGGFVVLYTLAGAAIGYAGKEIQMMTAENGRVVGVVTGIFMIVMGIWMGIKTRAPLVCKMPGANVAAGLDKRGIIGPALIAIVFSIGCMTCFSGAIIATLLVYVGSLGSASTGALVLFMFSIGVAVPFLLAALFLSRVMPVMTFFARHARKVGTFAMLVMIFFGLVLLTDSFHALSDAIYPYLGLGYQ